MDTVQRKTALLHAPPSVPASHLPSSEQQHCQLSVSDGSEPLAPPLVPLLLAALTQAGNAAGRLKRTPLNRAGSSSSSCRCVPSAPVPISTSTSSSCCCCCCCGRDRHGRICRGGRGERMDGEVLKERDRERQMVRDGRTNGGKLVVLSCCCISPCQNTSNHAAVHHIRHRMA